MSSNRQDTEIPSLKSHTCNQVSLLLSCTLTQMRPSKTMSMQCPSCQRDILNCRPTQLNACVSMHMRIYTCAQVCPGHHINELCLRCGAMQSRGQRGQKGSPTPPTHPPIHPARHPLCAPPNCRGGVTGFAPLHSGVALLLALPGLALLNHTPTPPF